MMITRIILAGATVVALGAPSAHAAPVGRLPLWLCNFFIYQSQCAIQIDHGDNNNAATVQMLTHRGKQFALTVQNGDGNDSYTEQVGRNEAAVTFQNGNNNTAYTSQNGNHQLSVTVQSGNGMWAATSNGGDHTVTTVVQSN